VIVHSQDPTSQLLSEGVTDVSMATQPLSPAGRASALKRLGEEELDVLIIGGGVVGAGSEFVKAERPVGVRRLVRPGLVLSQF